MASDLGSQASEGAGEAMRPLVEQTEGVAQLGEHRLHNLAQPGDQAVGTPADEIRVTRFSDVCGGTDELKRLVAEQPEFAAGWSGSGRRGA